MDRGLKHFWPLESEPVRSRNPLHLLRWLEEAKDSGEKLSNRLRSEIDYYFGSLASAKHALNF